MGTRVSEWRRSVRLIATGVVAVSLVAASAATLGGINGADLFVFSANDTVPIPFGYLHNNPTPPVGDTDSQLVLPLGSTTTAPTAAVLYNYDQDRDGDPGLFLPASSGLGESDPTKYQIWSRSISGSLQLQGQATLTLWSTIKDFETSKRGEVLAELLDCDAVGSGCVSIASGSLDFTPWNTGPTWTERTMDLGAVNYTIATGRTLRIKLVTGPDSGDAIWFAYDTSSYPSVFKTQ